MTFVLGIKYRSNNLFLNCSVNDEKNLSGCNLKTLHDGFYHQVSGFEGHLYPHLYLWIKYYLLFYTILTQIGNFFKILSSIVYARSCCSKEKG